VAQHDARLLMYPYGATLDLLPAIFCILLPSMVLFASVMLALHAYPEYPLVCSVSISLSVICFILRTHMLYQRMLREQGMLIARTGQLEDLATHDALTGIGNRRWLEQKAFEHLESAPGAGDAALLLIDADEFKWINDTFGHRAGDELLLAMSAVLREQVRNFHGACCARIGGDEFVALLPHVSAEAAMPLAEQIRQRIARLPSDFGDCHASVSIGVAVTSGPVPLASLLELADEALYRAKGRGRNLVELAVEDCVAFAQSSRHSEHRRFRD
jgi:diguanylate cyclase (GGDEF)-like protein